MKKLLYLAVSVSVALASNTKSADELAPENSTGLTKQSLVKAHKFMIATANPHASQAGYEVLKMGGNAIEAMIAAQATLGLTEPQSSGLGGGAYVLYYDAKSKKLTSFDAREIAPASATPERFLDKNGKPMEFIDAVVGGISVGVPGVPKLIEYLHKKYAKIPLQTLLQYPINLAQDGFIVSNRLAKSIAQNAENIAKSKSAAQYFMPNGKPLKQGDILKNQAYANSLKMLAKYGSAPFYTGELAQNIIKSVENASKNKATISQSDFASYKIIEKEPVCTTYRGYEVCGMGGSSSGGVAVGQILGIMDRFKPSKPGDIRGLKILGDASRLAFADRDKFMGDPDFINVPYKTLLSKDYLKERSELVKTELALKEAPAGEIASLALKPSKAIELPSTSHISIVDSYGNVLSMTTSIENAFGSTLMANGYLLNNELTDFSFVPRKESGLVANSIAPHKRPRSSMSPTIIMRNGSAYMSVGSPGGSRIIGYVAKTIIAHIDWGLNIQDAISYPNMLNRFGTYELEEGTSASDYENGLLNLGFKTQIRDLNSGVQAILIKDGILEGGADPRREGKVMGD